MEATGVIAGQKPGTCSNCSSSHPPKKCKAYGKECFHCHKKGHFIQFCHSKQHGKSPGSHVRSSSQNNRQSHCDVHEIDQSKFDDSVQFENYDSITIQFRTQFRHSNVIFDEISSTPSLQRVLTDVHIKAKGQSNWLKCRGACGNYNLGLQCIQFLLELILHGNGYPSWRLLDWC